MKRIFLTAAISAYALASPCQPLAEGLPKFLGCAYSSPQATYFTRYWNQVTPENGGKWGAAEPSRDIMNWSAFDAAFNLASTNGFAFKNHTLIWGNQQPSWIENLDTDQQLQEIEEWFSLTAARYPGMDYIDVVNEPLHAPPSGAGKGNYMDALGGKGVTGWDWVINSFKLARRYFPGSKLLINEYSVTNSSTSAQAYVNIINLLKEDTLIDGIGIQAHAFSTYGIPAGNIQANLDIIASTGLPIYISEFDIDGESDRAQLKEYMRVFPVFWNHPAVEGITLWGFRYGLWRTNQGAYLVTQAGTERPAFKWLQAFVRDTLVLSTSVAVNAEDGKDTIFIDEDLQLYADILPESTTIRNVSWTASPSFVASVSENGLLTPKSTGKVTVRATTWDSDKTGLKEIIIINRPVDSILIALPEDTVTEGKLFPVSALVYPENATNKKVIWSSVPVGSVITSDNDSLKAVTPGAVRLIASAADGSGVSDTINLTILPFTRNQENQDPNITVFPNPSRDGKFQVLNIEDVSVITVYDMRGFKILEYNLQSMNSLQIEIKNGPGIYLVVINKNRNLYYRKIRIG